MRDLKRFLRFVFVFLFSAYLNGYSQCATGNITTNPYLCTTYGDANGVSNWDWEVDQAVDYNKHCLTWQARTQQGNALTVMGSPFTNPATNTMYQIAINKDYTRAKGWELVTRDFGCDGTAAYPYFVLYNKYTTLLRVFVYQPAPQAQYSQVVVAVQPTATIYYPATTSLADELTTAPDKYLTESAAGTFGKKIVSVTEPAGSGGWYVAQFNMGFDPNISDPKYRDAALQFTIYGDANSDITADIKGSSISGDKIYDFNYVPTNESDANGKTFAAQGEKFLKFSRTINEARESAYKAADNIVNSLANTPYDNSVKGRVKAFAWNVREVTNSDYGFGKVLSNVADVLGIGGSVLKLIGGVVGFFSGSSTSVTPTYTSYNLTLKGTITCRKVLKAFVMRIPGTLQTTPTGATYYRCPMGIFNLKNTPQAEIVTYKRVYTYYGDAKSNPLTKNANYISLRMSNNLEVSYNDGAGLDLVAVQAAIVGQVQLNGNAAAYDLLKDQDLYGNHYELNYMLPDLQSGALEITSYDPQYNLHTFQTPFVNLECLNGLAFNARAETDVFLRVKAIMKKKNDPNATPLIYIRDYKIDTHDGTIDPALKANHLTKESPYYPTPYSNFPQLPSLLAQQDKVITGRTYNSSVVEIADNTITTEEGVDVIVPAGQSVTYKAGYQVALQDGFEAAYGSEFVATLKINERNLTCGTLQAQPYQFGQPCFNSSISPLRQETKPASAVNETTSPEVLKVYPVPTNGKLFIDGIKANSKATITILDQSGRSVKEIRSPAFDGGQIDLDVSSLSNGVYFVKIQTLTQTVTRKIVVSK